MITACRNAQIERFLAVKPVSYASVRPLIRNGDVALARPSSVEGLLIAEVTRAEYSHASMVGWLDAKRECPRLKSSDWIAMAGSRRRRTADDPLAAGVLLIGETRQRIGARLISLSAEIAAWPGYYDLFRVRRDVFPRFCNRRAWRFMARAGGARYAWRDIVRIWLRRRLGKWMPVTPNSDDPMRPRFCSALVHAALRAGGGPQVAVHDADVAPGDLANRDQFDYVATVFWTEEQAARIRRQQAELRSLNP
jgi:hypothetical protein